MNRYLVAYIKFVNIFTGALDKDCIPRKYDFDSVVCVCNSSYCDTIPKVEPLLKGNYILFTSTKEGLRFKRSVGSFKMNQTKEGE